MASLLFVLLSIESGIEAAVMAILDRLTPARVGAPTSEVMPKPTSSCDCFSISSTGASEWFQSRELEAVVSGVLACVPQLVFLLIWLLLQYEPRAEALALEERSDDPVCPNELIVSRLVKGGEFVLLSDCLVNDLLRLSTDLELVLLALLSILRRAEIVESPRSGLSLNPS